MGGSKVSRNTGARRVGARLAPAQLQPQDAWEHTILSQVWTGGVQQPLLWWTVTGSWGSHPDFWQGGVQQSSLGIGVHVRTVYDELMDNLMGEGVNQTPSP